MKNLRRLLTTIRPEESSESYFEAVTIAEHIVQRKRNVRTAVDILGQVLYAGAAAALTYYYFWILNVRNATFLDTFVAFYRAAVSAVKVLVTYFYYVLPVPILAPVLVPPAVYGIAMLFPVAKPLQGTLEEQEYARLNAVSITNARTEYNKLSNKVPVWPYNFLGCAAGFAGWLYWHMATFKHDWLSYVLVFLIVWLISTLVSRIYNLFWKRLGYNRGTELLLCELCGAICRVWPERDVREKERIEAMERAREERKSKLASSAKK